MTILDAKSKKIGILSAAAVSALVIFTGCNGPTIMENRDGVPSAKRELGYQKDNSLPGNISQATEKNNNFDTGLVANDENSSIKETSFTPDKKDEAEFYAVEFPRMEDMSKKTVGPKKETPTANASRLVATANVIISLNMMLSLIFSSSAFLVSKIIFIPIFIYFFNVRFIFFIKFSIA